MLASPHCCKPSLGQTQVLKIGVSVIELTHGLATVCEGCIKPCGTCVFQGHSTECVLSASLAVKLSEVQILWHAQLSAASKLCS